MAGAQVEVDRQLAISRFYREEFLLQLEHLQAAGILDETNREVAERARRALTRHLDSLCCSECFPALAASLLQSISALSGVHSHDLRQHH
jgi:hypothetical protein